MGPCTFGKPQRHLDNQQQLKLTPIEIELLSLMYQDLAVRSKNGKVTREIFDTFFHLNGLWGKQMFQRFHKQSVQATISQQEFIKSIDLMVKGSFSQKCNFLFKIYDIDNTGGVSFQEFLKMLYSYPKQQLKGMLTDENFLKSFDSYQLMFYFGPTKQLREKNIQQEGFQQESQKKTLQRIDTQFHPTSTQFIQIQDKLQQQIRNIKKKKQMKKNGQFIKMPSSPVARKNKQTIYQKMTKRGGSMNILPTYAVSKVKLTNNIASLVKKYAIYVFKELKLDKNKDQINQQQFKVLVQKQQKIFNNYFQGFHTYIWCVDIQNGVQVPQHLKMTPWIEDQCLQVYHPNNNYNQRVQNYRYLRFIKTTIFIYKKKGRKCSQIKNMQGLYVLEVINPKKLKKPIKNPKQARQVQKLCKDLIDQEFSYGILIKHRDGIYPQKEYFFKDRKTQKQWLRYLSEFKQNSIYNEYTILEKIGQGNYSSVYRGRPIQYEDKVSSSGSINDENKQYNNRNGNEDMIKQNDHKKVSKIKKNRQVAIKVIQKFKLSANENQVIKFQCGILQLCHHPNIVNFQKKYNTKTRMYIVTEYLGQGDLFQYTKKYGFLEQYQSAIIMKQLLEVVRYLNYELGLIHRDLKPENVLIITKQGNNNTSSATPPIQGTQNKTNMIFRIKLIDFGFAVYKKNLQTMSENQKFAGSPGYIAPQIFKHQEFDQGIDMFSLGIIMYFILSGSLPFHSPIFQDIVHQTVECNVCLNNTHWNNISDQAKDLLEKILTLKQERINVKQALKHPWLQDIEGLKKYAGKNKKNRYLG